ncbi:hypothetical protein J27TS7_48390 [Paenibacillus dendritiformis]|nr:hypothetical protein J27TS7_48390 [Paenibacillus dendritiformis]
MIGCTAAGDNPISMQQKAKGMDRFFSGAILIPFMHHLRRHERIAGLMNEGSYRHWQKIEAKGEQRLWRRKKTAAAERGIGGKSAKSCISQAVGKPLFFVKGWRWSIFVIQTLALRVF